jgi:hypothetical protein
MAQQCCAAQGYALLNVMVSPADLTRGENIPAHTASDNHVRTNRLPPAHQRIRSHAFCDLPFSVHLYLRYYPRIATT